MNGRMRLVVSFFLLLLVSCSASQYRRVEVRPYVLDDKSIGQFVLVYTNRNDFQICLSPGMWPNKSGRLDFAGERVEVVVGEERFQIKDFNTGYCPNCAIEVLPGETIRAFIKYEDFSLPKQYYLENKQLKFYSIAYECG